MKVKKKQKKKENLQPPGVSNKCNIIANLKCFPSIIASDNADTLSEQALTTDYMSSISVL